MGRLMWLLFFLLLEINCSLSLFPCSLNPTSLCQQEDCSALLQFKNSIFIDDSAGLSYYRVRSWNESTNCCSWSGVTCDRVIGHVVELYLYSSSLVGFLPANSSLFHLQRLQHLDLSSNNLTGELPDVFGSFNNLSFLDLSNCNFSGQLPSTLFNLTQLTHLDLSYNRFQGAIPTQVSGLQILEEFRLSGNLVTGEIPSWIFTLPSLKYLNLSDNKLIGPIDQIQKPSPLQQVYMANNGICGEITSFFFDLVNLTDLDLSSNNLSGVIKSDMLSKLQNLETLKLSNNRQLSLSSDGEANYSFENLRTFSFSNCNIKRFPNFLRTGKRLKDLDLSYNKIGGSILKWELEGWEQLATFNLSYNLLTALEHIPTKNLEILDLRSNRFQGPLPTPPPSLKQFFISNNNLTGEISPLICNLTSLEILDLSINSLGGSIPACLGDFSSSITTINLQRNNFSGKIPDSFGYNLKILALNNNQFEGLVPRSLLNCSSLKILNLRNNNLSDTFPQWLSRLPELQVLILRSNRFYGSLEGSQVQHFNFSSLQVIDLSHNQFSGFLPTKFFKSLKYMTTKIDEFVGRKNLELINSVTPRASSKQDPCPYSRCTNCVASSSYSNCKDASPNRAATQKICPNGTYASCMDSSRSSASMPSIEEVTMKMEVTMKRLEMELVISPIFILIDFSNNRFNGQIPKVLGEFHSLIVLNLSHNLLNGSIPPSFGEMAAVESLDLSSNNLGGRIPSQMTKLTFLAVFNLSQNNLEGPIPHGYQFDTFENDSYSGNLGLCGPPLSKKCNNNEGPIPLTPKFMEYEGFAIAFIWKLAMMGYGCGLVLGLSTGYIVFTTGKPWWFVRMVERDLQWKVTRRIHGNKGRRN